MDEVGTGGGSLYLAELIDEHGAALLSDFFAEYRIPLWDVLDWPPRIVLALVEGLPNREFVASLHGDEFRGWNPLRHTLADVFDLLASTVEWKGERPQYPRPVSKQEKRARSPFEIFGGVG